MDKMYPIDKIPVWHPSNRKQPKGCVQKPII